MATSPHAATDALELDLTAAFDDRDGDADVNKNPPSLRRSPRRPRGETRTPTSR